MVNNTEIKYALEASKVHKSISNDLINIVKPGTKLSDIAKFIEESTKERIKYNPDRPLEGGVGFPTSLSVNEVVAHFTPSSFIKDYTLKKDDIIKVDFGVHKEGYIIDSALTFNFDEKYDEFTKISKNLTNYGVSLCGPDAVLGDIGNDIEEYIKSKEITVDGKTHQLSTIGDLSGHNIGRYVIHNSKAVPNKSINYPVRMEVGEFFAVEPFITTGDGHIYYDDPTNLYMINKKLPKLNELNDFELKLFKYLQRKYLTLCFCDRWLDNELDLEYKPYRKCLNNLIKKKFIEKYPAIYDKKGCLSSQFEHTIYITEKGIMNLTKNNIY